MKAAIYDKATGKIISFVDGPLDFIQIQCKDGDDYFLDCPDGMTHIIDNEPIKQEIVREPTIDPVYEIIRTVQANLDEVARGRGYDNMLSLVSYINSTDSKFKAEAETGIAWRDACWRACYNALDEVKAGARQLPTPREAVLELPMIVWPD